MCPAGLGLKEKVRLSGSTTAMGRVEMTPGAGEHVEVVVVEDEVAEAGELPVRGNVGHVHVRVPLVLGDWLADGGAVRLVARLKLEFEFRPA